MNMSPNSLKTTLLLGVLTIMVIYLGYYIGGDKALVPSLFIACAINLGAYWFSDKIILLLYRAKEVRSDEYPLLFATAAYLSEKIDLPRPRLYVIDEPTPNAFAIGRHPQNAGIVVTTGILSLLNKEELAGVIAHEIAHVIHRDTLISCIAASIGGAISMMANVIQWIFVFGMGYRNNGERGNNKLARFIMSMIAPVAAVLIHMAISRTREYVADERAGEICGDPMWLADALRKLDKAKENQRLQEAEDNPTTAHLFVINPLHNKQWAFLFSTHPPIGERIARLENMA
jgi:heat shock protein HtpX